MRIHPTSAVPVIIAIIIIASNPPWPFWSLSAVIRFTFTFILFYILIPRIKHISKGIWIFVILLLFPLFIVVPFFRGFHFSSVITTMAFLCASVIKYNEYRKALDILTNFLAIIIVFSLPIWLIHVFVTPLPEYSQIDLGWMKAGTTGVTSVIMNNYIFFVTNADTAYFRFYSVFDEPGVLGTLSAFILYGNRYDFTRWQNIVILLGSFFTFSMAFFILTIVGLFIINAKYPKRIILLIMGLIFFGAISLYLLSDFDAFQFAVINRLFGDKSYESLLDGRTAERVNRIFNKMLLSEDVFLGIGYNQILSEKLVDGSSYKLFVLEYGVLGLIAMIALYFIVARNNINRLVLGLIFLFFLSFTQRPLIWTPWQIFLFGCAMCGVSRANSSKIKLIQNET